MKKQKGMTLISWLILLVIVLFNAIIALNIVPVYINDHSVKSLMKNIESDTSVRGKTPKAMKQAITKRLRINNIYNVSKEHIAIRKGKNTYLIIIQYEPRGKLIGNLDYIVSFKHEARIPSS